MPMSRLVTVIYWHDPAIPIIGSPRRHNVLSAWSSAYLNSIARPPIKADPARPLSRVALRHETPAADSGTLPADRTVADT